MNFSIGVTCFKAAFKLFLVWKVAFNIHIAVDCIKKKYCIPIQRLFTELTMYRFESLGQTVVSLHVHSFKPKQAENQHVTHYQHVLSM